MHQKDCDFSPLKHQLIDGLQNVSLEIKKGIDLIENEGYCLLGKFENIKSKFEQVETIAATFYLNCYLSPFTDKYLDLSTTLQHLSGQRHGALIVIEREQPLDSFVQSGIPIGAALTHTLLEAIFYPGNPLHDGAILVRKNQIVSAGNVLPLSNKLLGGTKLGTRHRAALGISELSDALVLVVSEETGKITFAMDGTLYPLTTSSTLL